MILNIVGFGLVIAVLYIIYYYSCHDDDETLTEAILVD